METVDISHGNLVSKKDPSDMLRYLFLNKLEQVKFWLPCNKMLPLQVWRFIDLDSPGKKVDLKTRQTLRDLQDAVKKRGVLCREFHCDWDAQGIDESKHLDHIKSLGDAVQRDLTQGITTAINNFPKLDACAAEVASHVVFCNKKAATFHGRVDLIDSAMKYYEQTPETHPLKNRKSLNRNRKSGPEVEEEPWQRQLFVVYGISGSGKTSLIATLVMRSQDRMRTSAVDGAVFVTRFCGTTPLSSSVRTLISSMAEQIYRAYSSNPEQPLTNVPKDYPALIGNNLNLGVFCRFK